MKLPESRATKVQRLMACLPRNELNEFGRYLATDFHNRREVLVDYFAILRQCIRDNRRLPAKSRLFSKLYPQDAAATSDLAALERQKVIRKRLDDLNYELKTHLEDFLVGKQAQIPGFHRTFLLMNALRERQADEFYFAELEKAGKRYDEHDPSSINHYLHQYMLEQDAHEHPRFERWNIKDSDISTIQTKLDAFYLTHKLMNVWVQVLQDVMFDRPLVIPMLEEVLAQAESPAFRDLFYIDCYRRAVRDGLLGTFNPVTGAYLRDKVLKQLDRLSRGEQIGMFNFLLNYHILIVYRRNLPEAEWERFRLIQLGLEKGFMLREGRISYADFYNAVSLSIRFKAYAWCARCITDFGPRLASHLQEPSIALAQARLKMGLGEFRAALILLSRKQIYTSDFDNMLHRMCTVKCYYELRETDLLEHLLEACRKHYARVKAIGETYRQLMQLFVRYTRRLFRAWDQPDAHRIAAQILEDIHSGERPSSIEWLEEKARELMRDKK
ncbi:MAG: hypothetical protein AAGN35_27245 [Bacteroidota bacterium]